MSAPAPNDDQVPEQDCANQSLQQLHAPPAPSGRFTIHYASAPQPQPPPVISAPEASPRQLAPPRKTDHTYTDYAQDHRSLLKFPLTKKSSSSNFPAKLHAMISDPTNAEAIQWQPHGRGACFFPVNCFYISEQLLLGFSSHSLTLSHILCTLLQHGRSSTKRYWSMKSSPSTLSNPSSSPSLDKCAAGDSNGCIKRGLIIAVITMSGACFLAQVLYLQFDIVRLTNWFCNCLRVLSLCAASSAECRI
jgi:hypothetical protein